MNYVGDAINQLIAVQQYKQGQQRQGVLDSQAERRNSLAEQFQRMQIEEMQRAQAQRTATQGAQRGIYENLDYLQGDFPQRSGELISEMGRQYPGADLGGLNSLAQQFAPPPQTIVNFGGVPYVKDDQMGKVRVAEGFTHPGKKIERTINLGDRERIIYTDGSTEDVKKGATPGVGAHGGADGSISGFTREQIDLMGETYNLTGQVPAVGRKSDELRRAIVQSGARQILERGQGAGDVVGGRADVKGIGSSIAQQEKQFGAMGSFVRNLDMQVDKVGELSRDLQTFDTRLLNIPLRAVRGRIAGSPLQAKYDMYLAEIESEIGKLATGSSASVAELSVGAQEKWAKIHDKNLSINDMMELLEETKAAGRMRMRSVEDQLEETRKRLRRQGGSNAETQEPPKAAGAPTPPKVGTVKNGYRYVGGNPADEKSWKKVQ